METKRYKAHIVVVPLFDKECYLLNSEPDLLVGDVYGGLFKEATLSVLIDRPNDPNNTIPKEPGLYKCVIRVDVYKCNHPLDPVEWETRVLIEESQRVELVF